VQALSAKWIIIILLSAFLHYLLQHDNLFYLRHFHILASGGPQSSWDMRQFYINHLMLCCPLWWHWTACLYCILESSTDVVNVTFTGCVCDRQTDRQTKHTHTHTEREREREGGGEREPDVKCGQNTHCFLRQVIGQTLFALKLWVILRRPWIQSYTVNNSSMTDWPLTRMLLNLTNCWVTRTYTGAYLDRISPTRHLNGP